MRGIERRADARADVHGQLRRESFRVVEQIAKRASVDEFHDHGLTSVVGHRVVHRDDVGVAQTRGGDRFATKTFGHGFVRGEMWFEKFDRDHSVELEVVRLPYVGHAAMSPRAIEPVPSGDHRVRLGGVRGRRHFECQR